jgi:23S rRNA (adenine2503-C2)-methyltransferase
MTSDRTDITALSRASLNAWLAERDIAPFRGEQIRRWIFNAQADSFEEMTNIKKDIRELLSRNFTIPRLQVVTVENSTDGCCKFLFELADGHRIESVLIPERTHDTVCISSQVGCAMGCRFCLTSHMGFVRDLTAGEIAAQVRDIKHFLGKENKLTNIVFMGMGEPLANCENVKTAIANLVDDRDGMGFSPRKITVSTSGLANRLIELTDEPQVQIAVSLNAVDNETRTRLMPINRKFPIETLLETCWALPLAPRRKITFEYILIKGLNDSEAHARKLARLLRASKAKVNLIPFNPHDGCNFERPDEDTVLKFQKILLNSKFTTNIRMSKGTDISAACGQLQAKEQQAHDNSGIPATA